MLREMLRREKRYSAAATAVAACLFLMMLFPLFLGMIRFSDPIPGIFCCTLPILIPPSIAAFMYIERYNGSHSMDQLLPLSRHGDVHSLIDQIDSEIAKSSTQPWPARLPNTIVDRHSNYTILTENWLLHFLRGRLWIVRIDDVLWAYKRINVTWTFARGEHLQFTVCISAAKGRSIDIIVRREADADQILELIIHRRPAILVGSQMPWQDLAKEGIDALRIAVFQREKQWVALSEDDQSDWLEEQLDDASNFVHRYDPRIHASEKP